MRELIALVSFFVALLGGAVAVFSPDRSRRNASITIAFVFITAHLLLVSADRILGGSPDVVETVTCLLSFALAVAGGVAAIFHKERDRQFVAGAVGFGALVVSLFLLV
jgi:hypothetical protein